jgi:tetratricopeptide (TPR) repeat protein
VVLPTVAAQAHTLRALADNGGPQDQGLLRLASHTAEYAGWMAQEAGSPADALRWTVWAEELAHRAADRDMAAYAFVRRAELELYRGDAERTLSFAGQASADQDAAPQVRALAAHRMAQGYALAGDALRCERALHEAAELIGREPRRDPGELPIGPAGPDDPGPLVAGWCWVDLGRPGRAADLLEGALAGTAPQRRLHGLFSARLARAHAEAGQLDRAIALGHEVLSAVQLTRSATGQHELRLLAGALRRRHGHPPAMDLTASIAAALNGTRAR